MMSTHGTNTNKPIVVMDTDGITAILSQDDIHHKKAVTTLTPLLQQDTQTIVPLTIVVEVIITLMKSIDYRPII